MVMPGRAARIQPANWLLVGRSSSITATRVMRSIIEWTVRNRSGRFLPGRERSRLAAALFLRGALRRMHSIVTNRRRSTMNQSTRRALTRFTLVAAASVAAASLWAQARPEQGLLLDAQTW